jgi:alpha-L-fucosidase 2
VTCLDSATLQVRGLASSPGMLYELLFRAFAAGGRVSCKPVSGTNTSNATLTVSGAQSSLILWVGDTEYSMDAGDEAHSFSFRGNDPHASLVKLLPTKASFPVIFAQHVADYKGLLSDTFSLSLGQKPQLDIPTDILRQQYLVDIGNPYLEWLTFNLGRYLLASSSRGVMPANLQGKWASDIANPWSAGMFDLVSITR